MQVLDLVRCGTDGGADRLGAQDSSDREVCGSRDPSVAILSSSNSGRRQVGGSGQLPVDLLDRLALGLDAEEIIHDPGHQEPAAEIDEGRWNLRQGYVRLEIVAGTDDQGEAYRPDDLADAAKAVGRAHARGRS